jgi:hypothetical protein
MGELSDEARGVLRDFILVFDLDKFFKGSTEVSGNESDQVLEYIRSMFELADIPAPTAYMTAKGLALRSKALRSSKQPFKREHAKFHELIKFAFELCHVNTADGFLPAIAEASVFFSIRHHTQNVETSFKHVDDLKIVSTNLSAQHLEDRVLDRVNNIMRDLEAARKQHVPVAGRMKPKPTDGKAASRGRQKLLRTSANCLFIARRALATCAQHYTFESMAAIRKKCRPKQAKRKRADDGKPYLAEHNRKTEHWSGRERTQSRDTLQHKAVAIVMTKKLKEDTDVEQLHTNAVKVVFKERKLDQVYHFMDPTTQKRVCASSTTQPAFMELVQDWLDANDQSGEVRQQCIEQHKKDADAKANAKSAKHAAAMAAMVTNTDAT